jgi:HB1, ASXL, restriction endonuclease HTH domain
MEKRTIVQAATDVLQEAQQPMTAAEITQIILDKNLYSFNTSTPISIVRNALERHCEGINRRNSAALKLFKKDEGSRYILKS